jgi:hypothetical protein
VLNVLYGEVIIIIIVFVIIIIIIIIVALDLGSVGDGDPTVYY